MDYAFENTGVSDKQLHSYAELLSLVFPATKKYTVDFLKWQYCLNPAGPVVGTDAYYNGELVAHYVTIPVHYTFRGQKLNGLLSLNTATHPAHQGKGLFVKLAQQTYETAGRSGYQFVIGVANQNSTHGFIKKLDFTLVAPLSVRIFLSASINSRPVSEFFQSAWTWESIAWRLKNPVNPYFKNKKAIVSGTHISFIDALLSQKECFSQNDLPPKSSLLKMTIGHNIPKTGIINLPLPDRFRPSPLNLILKPLNNFDAEIGAENIYFELIDFDAY